MSAGCTDKPSIVLRAIKSLIFLEKKDTGCFSLTKTPWSWKAAKPERSVSGSDSKTHRFGLCLQNTKTLPISIPNYFKKVINRISLRESNNQSNPNQREIALLHNRNFFYVDWISLYYIYCTKYNIGLKCFFIGKRSRSRGWVEPEDDGRDGLAHTAIARCHYKILSTHLPAVVREDKTVVIYRMSSHSSQPFSPLLPPHICWSTSMSVIKCGVWWHSSGAWVGRTQRSSPTPFTWLPLFSRRNPSALGTVIFSGAWHCAQCAALPTPSHPSFVAFLAPHMVITINYPANNTAINNLYYWVNQQQLSVVIICWILIWYVNAMCNLVSKFFSQVDSQLGHSFILSDSQEFLA